MIDKVQKIREEVERLHGNPYYMMAVNDVLEILDMQDEPVCKRFAFKAIPRLLDMIKPTDRAKAYIEKLADTLEVEDYSTDAEIVRESLKIMNGEKVPMATMDEEPVSEELEKAAELYTLDDSIKPWRNLTKEAFKAGAKWQKEKEYTCYEEAFEDGAKWQKEHMMIKAINAHCFGFQGAALFSFKLPADNYLVGSEVKVIVIKED